jgi:preprotein translocase subunit SecG
MPVLLIIIFHVLISIALIALVLLQRGRGAEMGAAFGAGASGTMFGSQGTTPFMVKLIACLAVAFFCTTLGLNYLVSKAGTKHQPDLLDLSEPGLIPSKAPANSNSNQQIQKQSQMPEKKENI